MKYFSNIGSLADLKKQYRALAMKNHPDRGGDTQAMQQINAEFEKLFVIWEHRTDTTNTASGYEDDYSGATAKQYSEYVYNEYRWQGRNYKGQGPREVIEIVRKWLKETYPHYTFSARRYDYKSLFIVLLKADFTAFKPDSEVKVYKHINEYYIKTDKDITDRAKEVMLNVYDFVMSYNFDDSDSMTDYFHTNFYLNLAIGKSDCPYKIELPKLKGEKGTDVFTYPEGIAHKTIRQALGKACFSLYETRSYGKIIVLGENNQGEKGEHYFWPLSYSSVKTAQKRIDKLNAAGIKCKLTGRNGGYILFGGYTEATEAKLELERQEVFEAMKKRNETKNKERVAENAAL